MHKKKRKEGPNFQKIWEEKPCSLTRKCLFSTLISIIEKIELKKKHALPMPDNYAQQGCMIPQEELIP